jgi:hypothetical protein
MSDKIKTQRLMEIVQPIPMPTYGVDVDFCDLEEHLERYARHWGLDLSPDFQRGHVWTPADQSAYIESMMRGTIGDSLRTIQFNASHWDGATPDTDLPLTMQIVDGLQRLTAARSFMRGEVRAFGMTVDDFDGTRFHPDRDHFHFRFRFAVHAFQYRADLLRYYLAINRGGVVHSHDELARVETMLEACHAK